MKKVNGLLKRMEEIEQMIKRIEEAGLINPSNPNKFEETMK